MTLQATAARDLIAFYVEAGVDDLVGEMPVNRLAGEDPKPPALATPPRNPAIKSTPASAVTAPPSPDVAAMAAREAVKDVTTLEALQAALLRFEGCALRATAT
jgi:uracil-DNA glycosylase